MMPMIRLQAAVTDLCFEDVNRQKGEIFYTQGIKDEQTTSQDFSQTDRPVKGSVDTSVSCCDLK